MSDEQAPGIPWHDHDWVEAIRLGATGRHYICAYNPRYIRPGGRSDHVPGPHPTRCPAEKIEAYPKRLEDGFRVHGKSGNFLRYAQGGTFHMPGSIGSITDQTPDDYRVDLIVFGERVASFHLRTG